MKLVSYEYNHQSCYGIYTQGGIIDLTRHLGHQYPTLKLLLSQPDFLAIIAPYHTTPDIDVHEIKYLPVIPDPTKIICAGMNYAAKKSEFNEVNAIPVLFIRFADTQTGHLTDVIKPSISDEFDYEGELAVIIGQGGRYIPQDKALEHIAGYSCYMDGSIRDWQHAWYTAGKNWPKTGAFGPCLVTADDIPDPGQLTIQTYLNGNQVQYDTTANLIYTVPALIAYISQFTTLSSGDVIITGSPGGVGKKRTPPLFMKSGDTIEVEISGIGRLCNRVIQD
ncbi:2-keto-4-pentenoate hydratase/2-oxohepta-3-ene-1,7-dioic acid hydratase in catechol pathway [Orbus hercynius]|uniref:2-keto-4-pentenoate hydratase/2-oxohepta-3-ene-1,7-dioic acid hydratase in catechol pathway n=1 Tax=Orbus hercynius TaxID=593135 RepID=A0A495RBU5_9GAMM|nr:fumarylacetoacetate hydrolase family protein [Orbus hercynius]RKS84801.1 2-keto-4-pentenoate hydratase/2-oxohepta-3-ene-1,7-dioic acid hydratase in catechol pathway [Orbus hercynius]